MLDGRWVACLLLAACSAGGGSGVDAVGDAGVGDARPADFGEVADVAVEGTDAAGPGPIDVETPWLRLKLEDAGDPRTVAAVMGVRLMEPTGNAQLRMVFGASFNAADADGNPEGFNIYSPDDPRYAYEAFVEPVSASVRGEADTGSLQRHVVTLDLPSALVEGRTYYVRAIGGRRGMRDPARHAGTPWTGYPITGGANAGHFTQGTPPAGVGADVVAAVLGLRSAQVVGPRHLRLVLGGAADAALLDEAGRYTVTGPGFEGGVAAGRVGRRSVSEVFVPGGGWPFPTRFERHDVYLELPGAMAAGGAYSVTADVTAGRRTLAVDGRNPHLKVNQEGYRPGAPAKWGYLGAWMGRLGPLRSAGARFVVGAAGGGGVGFEGRPTQRHVAGAAGEGAYDQELSGEHVYVCDFSALDAPGSYVLAVDGAGWSHPFRIAADVYRRPFQVSMRGLLYQRSGQSLEETASPYLKIAAHNGPVEIPYMEDRPIVGGHYDAGDYNPRSHFEVAHLLTLAYTLRPTAFYDGQLDIPEAGNGVPDVLDEAAWALRPWLELQDADGGVGEQDDRTIESPGDPNFVETPECDPLRQLTYAKNARGSLRLAGMAAGLARVWPEPGEAARMLQAAVSAYDFAVEQDPASALDDYAWAAAELAHTTGEARYTEDLLAAGYGFAGALEDGEDGRMRAAIAYATNTHPNADGMLRAQMRAGIVALADAFVRDGETYAYPHVQHPYAPTSWGTSSYPNRLLPVSVAWHLTGEARYRRWHVHSADLTLGANPLNLSWITGLGDRSIYGPLHLWGWNTYQGVVPPGLQSEGPHDDRGLEAWHPGLVPGLAETPDYYQYFDIRYLPGTQEGITLNMVKTAVMFALLLPEP